MPYITEYSELNPKERRQLEYKRKFKDENPAWDDSMILLRDLVAQRLPEQASVLDAGCGHGNFVIDELRDRISHAVGIDVNREVMSKNICLDEVVIGRLEALPFENGIFDAVISLWVLEHLEKPEDVFAQIFRVLKPGGFFAFATPNVRSGLIALRRLMNQHTADRLVDFFYGRREEDVFPVCYRANSSKDILALADSTGFRIESLVENSDPSYTSFDRISYRCSALLGRLPLSLVRPHLIGILRKI